ncbi:MAG: SpaA isopeptide-forming pilin-related protein [Thermoguttaceae bacterium]|nr:SpaA isopeptide-forming pilin-related protein [Thermoguttaceae bacterium]MDW8079654.1 SdrD B-like domain-containing protein [Thermoguttaceae bacterium]
MKRSIWHWLGKVVLGRGGVPAEGRGTFKADTVSPGKNSPRSAKRASAWGKARQLSFEPLEDRQLLSIQSVTLGMVYFEPAAGEDEQPNVFHLSFSGGAPGTRLTELVIDTDKLGDGLTIGDALFDTAPGGGHAFASAPLRIVSQEGIDRVTAEVSDGGTRFRLVFDGFEAGEKLVFSIDVDEMGFLGPNAVVEGNEFEGSLLWARFEAPHYYAAAGTVRFFDAFEFPAGVALPLPPDTYMPPSEVPLPVHTAGAILALEQLPLPASVEGVVFEDVDIDGQRDAGEAPIAGVVLELWRKEGDNYVPTGRRATTDENGHYVFRDIWPGVYRIVEVQPAGFFSVAAIPGSVEGRASGRAATVNEIVDIELLGGERGVDFDFAEARPASLQGGVFHDRNDNGEWDSGEEGIGGVLIVAEYGGPLSGEDVLQRVELRTGPDGAFLLTGLAPGLWSLREVEPSGYFDGKDHVGTAGGQRVTGVDQVVDIWLASGAAGQDYWFGELLPASVSGRVFADLDGDCKQGPGDYPLAGVVIWLLDADGLRLTSTTTDAEGRYVFDGLSPGKYGVEEIQPADYFDAGVCIGSAGGRLAAPDRVMDIVLPSGIRGTEYNFREWPPGSIAGYVYEDSNANGRRDPGEPGIAGVRILLLDETGRPTGRKTVTDASGAFGFDGLAPNQTYGLQEIQPTGYFDGRDAAGDGGGNVDDENDRITGISVPPGQHLREYRFGEFRPASLSGYVFADRNGNCQLDVGERPIAGVTVVLVDARGQRLASIVTDQAGRWGFEGLPPGVYAVEEIQPAGYFDGPECVGSVGGWVDGNDRIAGIKLLPGAAAVNYKFTEWEPARISGYVFQDGPAVLLFPGATLDPTRLGRTGQRGPQAIPLSGVMLRLMDAQGNPVRDGAGREITATTDGSGYYEFAGLPPGTYCVYQVHPSGYVDWIDTPGTHGGLAVNPGQPLDPAILETLATDPRNDAILRVVLRPGDDAQEYNFSELSTAPVPLPMEPPLRPPVPPIVTSYLPFEIVRRPKPLASPSEAVPRLGPGAGLIGSGGPVEAKWSWHLSVVNAGHPRQSPPPRATIQEVASRLEAASWSEWQLDAGLWMIFDLKTGQVLLQASFGRPGALPVVGDFDGDGVHQVAVFVDGLWFVDLNGNGVWDNEDLWLQLGQAGDRPVTGDWDGDGKTDVGIFGPAWPRDEQAVAVEPGLPDVQNRRQGPPKNLPPEGSPQVLGTRAMRLTSHGPLRVDVIDHVFFFGGSGAVPITGDWNGDGITNIGIFADGRWILDTDGDGRLTATDLVIEGFGQPGDLPVIGDWNGDGVDDLGLWRSGVFYLDSDGDRQLGAQDKVLAQGEPGDIPVAGDFNGDGTTEVGVYRPNGLKSPRVAREAPPPAPGSAF